MGKDKNKIVKSACFALNKEFSWFWGWRECPILSKFNKIVRKSYKNYRFLLIIKPSLEKKQKEQNWEEKIFNLFIDAHNESRKMDWMN